MDQNNPARYLDTAYGALKANPSATNQILQAAAQGAPVGLKGLAAAAAQQSQQQAQQAMAALQQQGPQPNIVQRLATQGIMSQMDTGLPMAPQMGAPEEMPQQMAGGGLVSFADGGNVLPPDVIEAIQSHFAEGGEVRGFAEGEGVWEQIKNLYRSNPFDAPSFYEAEPMIGTQMTPEKAETLRDLYSQLGTPKSAGEGYSFDELYSKAKAEEYKNKLLSEYSAAKPSSDIDKLSTAARKFNPEVKTPAVSPSWAEGKVTNPLEVVAKYTGRAGEAVSPYLSKAGRFVDALGPYAWALDPKVRALVKASVGAGKGDVSDILSGMGELERDTGVLKGLDALAGDETRVSKSIRDALGFADGGTVRGFKTGTDALLQTLSAAQESPGSRFLKGITSNMPSLEQALWAVPFIGGADRGEDSSPVQSDVVPTARDEAALDQLLEARPQSRVASDPLFEKPKTKAPATPATWKPKSHDGTEVKASPRVLDEGTNLYKPFKEAKTDVPSAAVTPDSQNLGGLTALGGLGNMEQMRDLIMSLGGHKEMSPEILQKLGDLEGSARTSTILQSALGALGAGLSNPYGGRYALGKAALGALSGYQSGIKSEEDIGRKAFDVLRGYADAPEEEKTAARDKMFDIAKKSAELQSEERRSALRGVGGLSFEERMLLKQAGDPRKGLLTQGDIANAKAQALKMTEDWAKTQAANPPFKVPTDAEKMNKTREFMLQILPATDERTIGGLGANIGAAQSSGLGGGTPRIYQ